MLVISPHWSTGGAPMFTLKKIELLNNDYKIMCVEYDFLSSEFVVQRNRIVDILGVNFISIGEHKQRLISIINQFKPDTISIEEFTENFISDDIAKDIYKHDREYTIIETTHSSIKCNHKKWMPDKFIFVSKYSAEMYAGLGIDYEIIEYPIDKKFKDVESSRARLEFDPEYKHVVNVGLFTQGKNQGYAFEIARKLKDHKIIFHFVGNLAGNFKDYWEPIMKDKPDNCKIWGERSDVADFLQASDLLLFTSKFELNPLVPKEALEYDLPITMFNLDTYCGSYDNISGVRFLSGDLLIDAEKILDILQVNFVTTPKVSEEFVFDKRDKLPQFLNSLGLIKGVEVGSFKGEFANTLLNNWGGRLYMVDVWRPLPDDAYNDASNHKDHIDAYACAMKNIEGFEDRASMLRMKSKEGSELFADNSLDFVYIDANHTYQSVKDDIEYWYPKVKTGGLFMGHDYIHDNLYNEGHKDIPISLWSDTEPEPKYAGMFGVTPAVNEFAADNEYGLSITEEYLGTWWVKKVQL